MPASSNKKLVRRFTSGLGIITLAYLSALTGAEQTYSPNISEHRTQLYWGDLHLHTALSADTYTLGGRLLPDSAYRFAMGETVKADNGMDVRIRYPLDFLAVTDHAEYLSIYTLLDKGDPRLADWEVGKEWTALLKAGRMGELTMAFADAFQNPSPDKMAPAQIVLDAWQDVVATADRFNRPHLFTTLPGYEWTSTISGDNLHRVVLFREGVGFANQMTPFSSQQSNDPEQLWAALAEYEREHKGSVLAIPHNSNVSNGRMFAPLRLNEKAYDREYAEARKRWEPVLEVTQVKGDSETHPLLSPTDRYANFERWDEGNIQLSEPKAPWMLPQEYARSALRTGLAYRKSLGVNPYEFGLLGSSDSHTGFSAVEEDNFFGKFGTSEPSAQRMFAQMADVLNDNWRLSASGLTAVWATENTREAIFDALARREVYATTGSRIALQLFGGWEFTESDLRHIPVSALGYRKGVPMGSVLPPSHDAGAVPSFLCMAMKEPDGPDLHALQIIKGWIDDEGVPRESVFDIATAGPKEEDGVGSFAVFWADPNFDPQRNAVYYVRVIEVPRPRWTARDAAYFNVSAPAEAPATIQDRAYSSPVWYYTDDAAR
jgi:hypothetical protein